MTSPATGRQNKWTHWLCRQVWNGMLYTDNFSRVAVASYSADGVATRCSMNSHIAAELFGCSEQSPLSLRQSPLAIWDQTQLDIAVKFCSDQNQMAERHLEFH